MGLQHPSTHGVAAGARADGETVLAAPTIGYLHTGIEKTAEQKKWQVIPLVERMDYLSAQSNSMAFCCRPRAARPRDAGARQQHPRVDRGAAAHQQPPVWLGTHGMEVGAVSVMLMLLRARAFLNINELLAGFRTFRATCASAAWRGSAARSRCGPRLSRSLPAKLDDEDLLTKNEIYLKRTQNAGVISGERWWRMPCWADRACRRQRLRCGSIFRISPDLRLQVPTQTTGDVYGRYQARRRDAREREGAARRSSDFPATGVFAVADPRHAAAEGSRLHDGSADSALPDLLAGLHRAAGEAYVPVEGPRGEHDGSCRTGRTGRGA